MIFTLRTRGTSLVETVVAVGILSLVFSIMASLVFVTARNAANVHQQVTSQLSAAEASQRVSTIMRDAFRYKLYTADSSTSDGPYTRLMIETPLASNTLTTSTVSLFVDNNNRREVRWFDRALLPNEYENREIRFNDGSRVTIPSPTATPTRRWRNIANFQLFYQSCFRVTMQVSYRYKGFAFQFSHPEYDPEGMFVTDAISRNHFIAQAATTDEGLDNYELETTDTYQLRP